MGTYLSSHTLPLDVGTIHFIGIGGIGMSGIAEILHNIGYTVQGSDLAESANVERLRKLGITVKIGQTAENVKDVAVVVRSSAVKLDNPEVEAARKLSIPVVRRAEMLAELTRLKATVAIAGTHGKTTTTSMTASLFEAAELDPTVINGGIINAYGTNARLGKGPFLIAEADESDGTFIKLPTTIGVITNIDPEHLENYENSFDVLKKAFLTFINNLPFYGFAVACKDHKEVRKLLKNVYDRKVISYGIYEDDVDIKASNISYHPTYSSFDVHFSSRVHGEEKTFTNLQLPMPGKHNVLNALAALGVAVGLGFSEDVIRKGFNDFKGVKRRFTKVGEVDNILFIDDYGHHPTEIAASLATARSALQESKGRVIAVVQPHRYSRLSSLFDEFVQCVEPADIVIITDVFAAGEQPIEGANQEALVAAIQKSGNDQTYALESPEALPSLIQEHAQPNDLVICLGAGNITAWANALPKQVAELRQQDFYDAEGQKVSVASNS